jgi:hypothetical protein
MHGKKNTIISEFLNTRDIYGVRPQRLGKDGVLRSFIDIGSNIPDQNVDGFDRKTVGR